ncbi:fatty-acyl-CoA synthase [Pseudosulfitobacter pseudonitzschiae]|uniref:3-methylmercaptopropionyl-CoA ligase n=1 Tax=Pseudosulfitobacter pseudonitzschiae TaxID=1402135 RepID=A0A073IZX9_9RHOB|nr:fatty acyl-CoA synthetase [Pseudosulfitobacter pseudonitzschiae]KEJ95165.1 acyl-CoA synthetase [Pseudosulfitobacter pseudonitzschiae]QKS11417.1 long-chain-fatty-acid--CoA ligase [Pseudosulfitobacter pseudonitzschiae]SHF89035.1 fatty-acyl-CoA synthase [Pseudosulfitobacter pseudonitzschiae]
MGNERLVRRARSQQLGDLLRRSAARVPNKTALVFRDQSDTFVELDAAVNRAANALRARGISKGDRVALFTHNNRSFVVLRFALARLGAIATPVNFMLNAEDFAYILDHSGARMLVAEDALCAVADAALSAMNSNMPKLVIPHAGGAVADGWEPVAAILDHDDAAEVWTDLAGDDPVQMMYTSGTESRPKGALLSSDALYAQYVSCIVDGEMTGDAVSLHCLPLFHCAQLDCFLSPDLYLGVTSILHEKADPADMLAAIEDHGVTKLFCPPTVWIALLRHPDFDKRDLSSLNVGYYGASIMPTAVIEELMQRLPNMRLFNFYGQTEMAPVATILRPEDQVRKLGSAGRPALNVETRVVDDNDEPVAVGEVGEVVHRSPHLISEYYNDTDKTADAFRNGWFHSGDLGRYDDEGYLYIVDRKKDMIKTGGENVASREVEEAIFRHPEVAEVAVFGVPHPKWIEAVTAIVVLKAGATATVEQIQTYCRETLTHYKAPKHIAITDQLPKNASGKILKRDLRQQYGDVFAED